MRKLPKMQGDIKLSFTNTSTDCCKCYKVTEYQTKPFTADFSLAG